MAQLAVAHRTSRWPGLSPPEWGTHRRSSHSVPSTVRAMTHRYNKTAGQILWWTCLWLTRNALDLLFGLVSAVERLRGSDAGEFDGACSVRSGRAPQVWRVSDRLNGTDVQRLISCYRDGVTVRELAEQFKISMTSVKRLLREHRARRKDEYAVAGAVRQQIP